MYKALVVAIVSFICATAAFAAIPANELPFGSYSLLPGQDISDILPVLHDTLGFNIF